MTAIVQALLGELNLRPENDISNAASSFTDVIKGYIRTIHDNASMKSADRENEILAALYQAFFEYSVSWANIERGKAIKIENHPEAERLKQAAAKALEGLQKNIIRYVVAYANIDRAMGFVHKEMKKHEGTFVAGKKFQWTADTGTVLRRYQKERNELLVTSAALKEAANHLQESDKHFKALEEALIKLHGKQDGPKLLTSFRSNLRISQFDKAANVIKKMCDVKKKFTLDKKANEEAIKSVQVEAPQIIKIIENAQEEITSSDGKLLLSGTEIGLVISAQEREIEQKSKYIDKYHQPYMENKLKSLEHLREKLLVFGSIESLTTLYMRLMRGMAEPLRDMAAVREYESEVINNVDYILGGQFQEVPNIEKRTVDSMQEFEEAMADFAVAP